MTPLGRSIVMSAAMSRVPDAALDAYGAAVHAIRRTSTIATGARMLGRGSLALRTMTGRGAHAVVAGEFFHGPGDREAAIASLSADFAALQADLTRGAVSPEDAAWALGDVVPVIDSWRAFVARQRDSMLAPYVTDWSAFETWQATLVRLRELAAARRIPLESAPPIPLPQTVWERGTKGTGSQVDFLFTAAKWIVYAAIGILGFGSLYSALRTTGKEISQP